MAAAAPRPSPRSWGVGEASGDDCENFLQTSHLNNFFTVYFHKTLSISPSIQGGTPSPAANNVLRSTMRELPFTRQLTTSLSRYAIWCLRVHGGSHSSRRASLALDCIPTISVRLIKSCYEWQQWKKLGDVIPNLVRPI